MKNSQKGFVVPLIIAVVAVLVVGGGYYFYKQANCKDCGGLPSVENTENPKIIGGDKDEHGCLGPAGYSWCEAKQKCLRTWEEKCEVVSTNTDDIGKKTSKFTSSLSEESIIGAIGEASGVNLVKKSNGRYETPSVPGSGSQYYGVNKIVKGDINEDEHEDAIADILSCDASCGTHFVVILGGFRALTTGISITSDPEGIITSSAAKDTIKNIEINNGIISIQVERPDINGVFIPKTFNYKFDGKNLIRVK